VVFAPGQFDAQRRGVADARVEDPRADTS
jgi:hypothetical protein